MSNTNAQFLEQLKLARDKISADIVAGKAVTSFQVGSKMYANEPASVALDNILGMINRFEAMTATTKRTNRARIRR